MSRSRPSIGPDVLIAGAARSGTTALAAQVARHPAIAAPVIKEPNYFSTRLDRGSAWYDSLYPDDDHLRLDASAQYTYPSHLSALARVHEAAAHVKTVYIVREPIERAFSQYCHEVLYLHKYPNVDFGTAVASYHDIAGASDYPVILSALHEVSRPADLLLLTFEVVTTQPLAAARAVWRFLDLDAVPDEQLAEVDAKLYANERGIISNPVLRKAFNAVRHTRIYPRVRGALGAARVRTLRAKVTSAQAVPTLADGLATCDDATRERLSRLRARAAQAVIAELRSQEERTGESMLAGAAWLEQQPESGS